MKSYHVNAASAFDESVAQQLVASRRKATAMAKTRHAVCQKSIESARNITLIYDKCQERFTSK